MSVIIFFLNFLRFLFLIKLIPGDKIIKSTSYKQRFRFFGLKFLNNFILLSSQTLKFLILFLKNLITESPDKYYP